MTKSMTKLHDKLAHNIDSIIAFCAMRAANFYIYVNLNV